MIEYRIKFIITGYLINEMANSKNVLNISHVIQEI